MSIFRRMKKTAVLGQPDRATAKSKTIGETSPQKVGVVSSVLPSGSDVDEHTPFSDVVSKRFGPNGEQKVKLPSADAATVPEPAKDLPPMKKKTKKTKKATAATTTSPTMPPTTPTGMMQESASEEPTFSRKKPQSVDTPLFTSEEPELETDPMANIGRATTITGDIVAEEDLEIHGTIEGSVRLVEHQVTVGNDGLVKASVDANIVLVHGKITGDVTATDLIEVKPGGIVGGDVKAPRVIMHDGAVIVGGLDMSSALPGSANATVTEKKVETDAPKKGERPVLKQVGLPPVHANQGVGDGKAKQG